MTGTSVLQISDSIGLGHAARDLAIARELRVLNPELEIKWLAGDPARRLIAEAGETLLPETEAFAHETGVAENASGEFSLNVLRYALRAQGAWKRAVSAFKDVTARYPYDLLIGDESYEITVEIQGTRGWVRAGLAGREQATGTAIGAAGVVRALAEGEVNQPGIWLVEQVVPPRPFFERLAAYGLVPMVEARLDQLAHRSRSPT